MGLELDCLTLFPEMLDGFLNSSMLKRGQERGVLSVRVHSLRKWAPAPHHVTDDRPFGGGAGMLLKPEPIVAAIEELSKDDTHVVYLCPDGEPFSQALAEPLAQKKHIIFLSGHYEGVDQRVRDGWVHQEISIGDYVLTNGALPTAVVLDATARLLPGFLGEEKSLTQESFKGKLLGFAQYTRPAEFRGMNVPAVLLSGNHEQIAAWRQRQRIEKTQSRRPDLLQHHD